MITCKRSMNRIVIRNLELYGHHGVYTEEREKGQQFWVDVELEGDFAAQDELSETADYSQVIESIKRINSAQRFQLIESFARAIAQELLREFPRVRKVKARVKKRPVKAAALPPLDWVAAEEIKERSL